MSGLNWWRRIGLVVCIVASVGVVSGCEFNMDNLRNSSQVKATQSDSEKEIWRVFKFYLAATNEFNFTSVKYSHQHMETVQQARQNIPLAEFKERNVRLSVVSVDPILCMGFSYIYIIELMFVKTREI